MSRMSNLPPPPPPPPPGRGRGPQRPSGDQRPTPPGNGGRRRRRRTAPGSWPRWTMWVLLGVVALALVLPSFWPSDSGEKLTYTEFIAEVQEGNVESVVISNNSNSITGELRTARSSRPPVAAIVACRPSRRGAAQGARRRVHVQDRGHELVAQHRRAAPAGAADHRLLRVDAAPGRRPDGQRDVHRAQPGEGVHDGQAVDDVRRHRRLRGRQAGDHGGRRLPADARPLPGDRRPCAEGHAAGRPAGDRQDAVRPGRRR